MDIPTIPTVVTEITQQRLAPPKPLGKELPPPDYVTVPVVVEERQYPLLNPSGRQNDFDREFNVDVTA